MTEEFVPNLLIEASAGTGKTQALAERIIDLLQRQRIKPQEIVALTFSRAAAGEIFGRLVSLLAERSLTDPSAAVALRETIATQHLSQIGTLDSFLMRMVRSFPLELGLSGECRILDERASDLERSRVSFAILRKTDAATAKTFQAAFALAMNRTNVRSFVTNYRAFIKTWHEQFLAMPEVTAWGDPSVWWSETPVFLAADEKLLAAAAARLEALSSNSAWPEFVSWVRDFRGDLSAKKGIVKKLFELDNLFGEGNLEFSYKRANVAFDSSASQTIRDALKLVLGYEFRRKLEMAAGIRQLLAEFEREYAKSVRSTGALVFGDVPMLISELPPAVRLALEYRLDAKIRAWALDEFQDTSREQWRALSNLVEEAKQSGGEKSVLIVGDRKQAIYGWRHGDVGIFTRERLSGAYATRELKRTYRSGPAIIEAVNRVFVDGPLKDDYPTWEAPRHETAKPELKGLVQHMEAGGRTPADFVAPLVNALRAVSPVERGIATAILVRSNGLGEFLATELKAAGIKNVVWEGESEILDTPALMAFLDLTVLADHPGDKQAYQHFIVTPLARAKYASGEMPQAAELSNALAHDFATKGIVRVFQEWRSLLPVDPRLAWSESVELRFTELLHLADRFELEREAATRISDFAEYVYAQKKRQVAEKGRIKIMTIHRSKGLGFDYVLLPLCEQNGLPVRERGALVGPNWVLPNPGAIVAKYLPQLKTAWALACDRVEQEALCMYYVAMTRAKRSLTIITTPTVAATRRFSDYVHALPPEIGDKDWYTEFPLRPEGAESKSDSSAASSQGSAATWVRPARETIRRRLPSLGFAPGQRAGELFKVDARVAARERGIAIHAEYEQVEFDEWLQRPEGFSGLWRERAFEIFANGEWISGRFDRVVFTGEGADRRATIYDFKTNRNSRHLPPVEFVQNLKDRYRPQLAAYRQALSTLTGIPLDHISAALLLTETREQVEVA